MKNKLLQYAGSSLRFRICRAIISVKLVVIASWLIEVRRARVGSSIRVQCPTPASAPPPPLLASTVIPSVPPAGHLDLLTAVMHEMGHKLGLSDSYAEQDRDNI